MKPDLLNRIQNSNVQSNHKFEHRKGYFIIEADPIMTENYIVNVQEQYLLVEFGSGGRIDYRVVVFWDAAIKNGVLKILMYDLVNKVVIAKMYNTKRPNEYSNWFLISEDFFDGEMLEFK